jgi:MFS family permease
VRPGYLGGVLAWRGLAGFGAGAVAPIAFGLVLDATTNTGAATSWGLGFAALGAGGAVALACALLLRKHRAHAVAHGPHDVARERVGHEKRE